MACWTLWKRLPPRYQLTTRESFDECPSELGSPRTPRSARCGTRGSSTVQVPSSARSARTAQSPRIAPPRGHGESPLSQSRPGSRKGDELLTPRGQATMYFTVASPRDIPTEVISGTQPAFPPRKSSYVNNFKHQQRINSARQAMEDPSTSTPKSYTPTMRARTAPSSAKSQFPITHISSHQGNQNTLNRVNIERANSVPARSNSDHSTKKRNQPKTEDNGHLSGLAINTIIPFEDKPKPFLRNPMYPDRNGKRYIVRNLDNAMMFIDDSKVVVIKNNKSRLKIPSAKDDHKSYLAHLRRIYLTEPRDLAKCPHDVKKTKGKLIRERLEYDKKTDHILSYYSREDDRQTAYAWSQSVEEAYRQRQPQVTPRSARERSRVSSAALTRHSSARARPVSGRRTETPHFSPERLGSPRVETCVDALADWNTFLKINARSVLHDRQFYLQTPADPEKSEKIPETEDCECRFCRLEMEMGLYSEQEEFITTPPVTPRAEISKTQGTAMKTTKPQTCTTKPTSSDAQTSTEKSKPMEKENVLIVGLPNTAIDTGEHLTGDEPQNPGTDKISDNAVNETMEHNHPTLSGTTPVHTDAFQTPKDAAQRPLGAALIPNVSVPEPTDLAPKPTDSVPKSTNPLQISSDAVEEEETVTIVHADNKMVVATTSTEPSMAQARHSNSNDPDSLELSSVQTNTEVVKNALNGKVPGNSIDVANKTETSISGNPIENRNKQTTYTLVDYDDPVDSRGKVEE